MPPRLLGISCCGGAIVLASSRLLPLSHEEGGVGGGKGEIGMLQELRVMLL